MFDYSIHELIVLPISLIVIIGICIASHFIFKNKNEKIINIPFLVIACLLLALEVAKQALSIIDGSWSWWTFPLHFCSLYMIWFSLDAFGKGRVKQVGKTLSFVSCIFFLILFYFDPTSIIGDSCKNVFGSFYSFHTFFYHHCIILYLGLMITLKTYKTDFKKDLLSVIICYSTYFVVAVTLGNLTQTNYCNLLYSNITFMQSLLDAIGYIPYLIIMYVFGIGVPSLLLLIKNFLHKRINNNENN